jgi:23S rRNA (uracil1939-C5)-methyltransferase
VICRHEGVCGGCGLQALSYAEQLDRKSLALLERVPATVRRAAVAPLFLPLYDSAPWHFRQKVAFVFGTGPDGRQLTMGHYARGSQRVVPVAECPVHSARGNRIAFALRDRLAAAHISAAGPSLTGIVRHLLVRTTVDDREAVAMLVVTRNDKALRKPVRALLASADRPDGFYINIHDGPGPFMVGRESVRIDGHAQIRERVGGVSYLVSPPAFFQTNVRAARVLVTAVVEALADATFARVLDLYAGVGLFALPLAQGRTGFAGRPTSERLAGRPAPAAPRATSRGGEASIPPPRRQVTAVEENREAMAAAVAAARENKIPEWAFRALPSPVEAALPRLTPRTPAQAWDAVILDPPREGCPPVVLDWLFDRARPRRLVYVSCNPDALARDLRYAPAANYAITRVQPVDMFPHTAHIETVVVLDRG